MTASKKRLTTIEYVRSILSILVFFVMLLLATPVILLLLIISFGRMSNFVVEQIAPFIVKPVFWVAGIDFQIKKHCKEVHYPAVYIVNHSSTLDILTILALGLPKVRFVAKWQLQYNPFKKGPFRMAMDLNYPIVPIYFEGNRELSEGGFLFTHSGKATAHIYKPIPTDEWNLVNIDVEIDEIRNLYLNWAGITKKENMITK
jgi:1-acyl-sn-glycerol-3-phosphate acyltransferase